MRVFVSSATHNCRRSRRLIAMQRPRCLSNDLLLFEDDGSGSVEFQRRIDSVSLLSDFCRGRRGDIVIADRFPSSGAVSPGRARPNYW